MKNLKNNAYSIQKLWMGEWRCQLYVHYMFWCNQKHWEYVVLCCKNKSISDIAVLLLKIKPLQNLRVWGVNVWVRALCWGFPVVWHHFLFVGPIPTNWLINSCLQKKKKRFKGVQHKLETLTSSGLVSQSQKNILNKHQTTICGLQTTMQQSISNETHVNLFSQLAMMQWQQITPLPNVLKIQDCFSSKI